MKFKDDTPALFISEEGAKEAARKVASAQRLRLTDIYAQLRSVRDEKGWAATYVLKGNHNARYVTNDDVERFL